MVQTADSRLGVSSRYDRPNVFTGRLDAAVELLEPRRRDESAEHISAMREQ